MRNLTKRQKEIFIFICYFIRENGFPPTIREIGERFSISSTNGVSDHLRAIERKGYLTRTARRSRSMVPSPAGSEFFFNHVKARSAKGGGKGGEPPRQLPLIGNKRGGSTPGPKGLSPVRSGHTGDRGKGRRVKEEKVVGRGDQPAGSGSGAPSPSWAVFQKLSRISAVEEKETDGAGGPWAGMAGFGEEVLHIPLLGKVAAGQPILAVENVEDAVTIGFGLMGRGGVPDFALRVTGDSMIGDGIFTGDLVFIKQCSTAETGEIVVALLDDEATIKRFFRDGEKIRLQPSNPSIKPIVLQGEQAAGLHILGKVVGLSRSY